MSFYKHRKNTYILVMGIFLIVTSLLHSGVRDNLFKIYQVGALHLSPSSCTVFHSAGYCGAPGGDTDPPAISSIKFDGVLQGSVGTLTSSTGVIEIVLTEGETAFGADCASNLSNVKVKADTAGTLISEGSGISEIGGVGGALTCTWTGTYTISAGTSDTGAFVEIGTIQDDAIIPNSASNQSGAGTFAVSIPSGNTVPTVSAITPSQTTGSIVAFSPTVADSDSDVTNLIVEHSIDGITWTSSTLFVVTETEGVDGVTTSTGNIADIDTDNDGSVTFTTIQWDAGTDLPNTEDSSVFLRATPNDGTLNGSSATSSAFVLDTKDPTAPGNLTIANTSTTAVTFTYGTVSTDDNFVDYRIFYKEGSSGVTTSDTSFTSTTDSNLGSISFSSATTSTISSLSLNTQYVANIWAFDGFAHSTAASSEIAFYTLAAAPGTPTISSVGETSMSFTFAGESNPTTTVHSIFDTNAGLYVAADNDLDATTAIFQTTSTWSTPTISGLSLNTQYCFGTLARNGDNIETATTTAACAYTLAAGPGSVTTDILSSKITVSWNVNGNPSGTEFYASISSGGSCGWSADLTTCTFTGLSQYPSYVITVKSRNGDTIEAVAGALTLRTLASGGSTPTASTPSLGGLFNGSRDFKAVVINDGESETDLLDLQLTLKATNVTHIAVAIDGLFNDVSFEPFSEETSFRIPVDVSGDKLVCVRFRAFGGGTSDVCDSIKYVKKQTQSLSTSDPEIQEAVKDKEVVSELFDDGCPLVRQKPYRVGGTKGVYYITVECTKRIFTSPDIYFSYFRSWDEISVVTLDQLSFVEYDSFLYVPWGPFSSLSNHSFVNVLGSSKIYFILEKNRHLISSPEALKILRSPFEIIHVVGQSFLDLYFDEDIILENHSGLF